MIDHNKVDIEIITAIETKVVTKDVITKVADIIEIIVAEVLIDVQMATEITVAVSEIITLVVEEITAVSKTDVQTLQNVLDHKKLTNLY